MITPEDIISMTQIAGIAVTITISAWAIAMMFPALFLSAANLFLWMAPAAGAMFLAWYYVSREDYALLDPNLMQIETYKGVVRCGNCKKYEIMPLPKGSMIHNEPCRYCGCLALEGVERQ